jgi:hypothetical protein
VPVTLQNSHAADFRSATVHHHARGSDRPSCASGQKMNCPRVVGIELDLRRHTLFSDKYKKTYRENFRQFPLRTNSSDSHHRLESFWQQEGFRLESIRKAASA